MLTPIFQFHRIYLLLFFNSYKPDKSKLHNSLACTQFQIYCKDNEFLYQYPVIT